MSESGRASLVTGGAGFVGSHLVERLLARGAEVRVLLRSTSSRAFLDPSRARLVEADLADASARSRERLARAMDGCDVVYHVAGVLAANSPEAYGRVNVEGTERVARAAASAGVRRLVVVSSQAAAGPSAGAEPRTEDEAETPITEYGRSKLQGERAALRVAGEGGAEVVIVRPPAVYGPRDRSFLQMFRLVARGVLPLHASAANQLVSVIHVGDLVEGITLVAERAAAGGVFFLCDGERHNAYEIGTLVARALDKKPLRLSIPLGVLRLVAAASEAGARRLGRVPFLTRERILQWTAPSWTISDARARRELGYASRIELGPGLAETAAWYRNAGWL